MIGIFNVNKPLHATSHDVVDALRRLTGVRRIGHTGTLDPLATGVLVLLVGPATRLARFLAGAAKSYRAVIRLGGATATYDAESEILERRPVRADQATLAAALDNFRGELAQIPPMYSAIKIKGQPLYKLARRGEEIARPARSVTIHELELLAWESPDLTVDVRCSAGTYIRSLAHDLGAALGCGGHLRSLVRTAVGEFQLADSYTLEELSALAAENRLREALLPSQTILSALPVVELTSAQVADVRYGRQITLEAAPAAAQLQAHNPQGELVALLVPIQERWRPNLVLSAN
ncbi:MAG TPA: tRNA pseudouridine(55) synthase TruB [Thermoflexia bacterium]|nr:tRNA pseudouridine(55) synthase TruB [Thermoflexia bacterium]